MSSPLPGLSTPAVGFEVPLEMLSACHGRVQAQCETLQRLQAHLARQGADRAAQEAAAAVLRYFDTAAQHHHADEEQDLFPALRAALPDPDPQGLGALIDTLLAEHRELDTHWQALRPALAALAAGQAVPLPAAPLQALTTTYARHIEREEQLLLPAARQLLNLPALDHLGAAMRRRRGVAWPAGL